MAFATLFSSPDGPPELTVKAVTRADGAIQLLLQDASPGLFSALAGSDGPSPGSAAPVETLFPHDVQPLDEWVEFFVRVQHGGYAVKRYRAGGSRYCKKMVQYFHALSGWVLCTVCCEAGSDRIAVQLASAAGAAPSAPQIWQVLELKQTLYLEKVLSTGGRWELDVKENLVFLTRQVAGTLGLANAPVVVSLDTFLGTVHPEDLEAVTHALANVGSVYTPVASRSIRPDGSILHFESFGMPEYGPDGSIVQIIGISQDVTEQVRAKELTSLSQQRLSNMLEQTGSASFIINDGGLYSYASPNVQALYGISSEEIVGKRFGTALAVPEDGQRAYEEFLQIMQSRAPGHIEFQYHNPAQHRTGWARMSVSPLINTHGELLEAVASVQDVTREHTHEDRLRYLQTHDILTDTHNRAFFEQELDRIQREDIMLVSLIIADLNGLKVVNDAFGHERGDEMLVEAASTLKSMCDPGCTIARIGGDEFAVLLYDTPLQQAEAFSETFVQACKNLPDRLLPISIACGVACRKSLEISTSTLYRMAESRLINSKLLETRSMHSQVIASLKEAIGVRNVETFDHMTRMENMVTALGKRLGLRTGEFDRLLLLASLHDIGKVAIPDHIINKAGHLSHDEWLVMRSHSDVGYRIAMASSELSGIAEEVRSHHERWDGGGYPAGKREEEIPLLSRIISVVDAYDVMTNRRVYKEPISHQQALEELRAHSGSQFDPTIVALFLEIFGSLSEEEMQQFTAACNKIPRINDDRCIG